MLVVHVHIEVKEEHVAAFIEATRANCERSLLEPGVVRFDLVQARDDATRFVLVEAYRDDTAPLSHKETSHYQVWRDTVAEMMKSPRTSVKYESLAPADALWETAKTAE